jgi:ElaB/YqjD/DUF883 family membrane-anchored ribosome-binding protein/ribosome recycling factor
MTRFNKTDEFGHDRDPVAGDAAESGDVEEIRGEIEVTRIELGATLDAIQDRLDPEYLKVQAKDVIHDAAEQARFVVRDVGQQARDVVHDASRQAKEVAHDATIGNVEEAWHDAARSARGAGRGMLDTMRRNPIPTALLGIGLGWLFFKGQGSDDRYSRQGNRRQGNRGWTGSAGGYGRETWRYPTGYYAREYGPTDTGSGGYESGRRANYTGRSGSQPTGHEAEGYSNGRAYESSGEYGNGGAYGWKGDYGNGHNQSAMDRAQDTVGNMTSRVQDTAGQVAGQFQGAADRLAGGFQETMSNLQDTGQEWTMNTQQQFQRVMRESPMMLGGMALAAGLAVGLALPETDREDELFGEARESLVEQVKDTARETQDRLQQAAQEAFSGDKQEEKDGHTASGSSGANMATSSTAASSTTSQ